LYYTARSAEIKALLADAGKGDAGGVATASAALEHATATLHQREADGAYLRNAHAALQIARRSAYFMSLDPGSDYGARLAPFVKEAAKQVELNAADEKLWYPGMMLRVALDTSDLRKKTPAEQPLDEKFNPQVKKHPGETVELEMTVYNWTSAALEGRIAPVLPKGWKPEKDGFDYKVEPKKFARFTTMVTIPADAAAAIYPIGASTSHKGTEQRELHAYRVEVAR
ncbi:MAG TPA: NEW3 domain-containing protein, partial [Tepidisphaeraceae bacterium]